jgi:hypothetical protein
MKWTEHETRVLELRYKILVLCFNYCLYRYVLCGFMLPFYALFPFS